MVNVILILKRPGRIFTNKLSYLDILNLLISSKPPLNKIYHNFVTVVLNKIYHNFVTVVLNKIYHNFVTVVQRGILKSCGVCEKLPWPCVC